MGDGIFAAAGGERAFGRRDRSGCGERKGVWDRFCCGPSGEFMTYVLRQDWQLVSA